MTTDGETDKIERAYREMGQESPDHERRLRLTAREAAQLEAELDGP